MFFQCPQCQGRDFVLLAPCFEVASREGLVANIARAFGLSWGNPYKSHNGFFVRCAKKRCKCELTITSRGVVQTAEGLIPGRSLPDERRDEVRPGGETPKPVNLVDEEIDRAMMVRRPVV